ncbi:tRNA dihydrouridine synthase DusB [Rhizobium rhizolycopersici]|uniref:tRNA-dihydrouridine synthase n=1 Tax=Mycoplana rhizolycopersici TaxID=2746702 RepID=A0ABX2QH10_9HYPH|nr:tRNA dihydrouridine synthase DusB [Rhizobium rhizolycopersici]
MACLKDEHLTEVSLSEPLSIGRQVLRNRVVLAPMSGVTDLPFRELAWRFGAGLVVTEMVASRELAANAPESWARIRNRGIRPHMVQLAGRDADWMAEAARLAEANGADIIDINMGCPAKKVIGGYSGSALMREPDHALRLIEATVKAVTVPVTVKMRLGWDHDSLNAPDIAARAEGAGVQMITVHGRTRMQFYEGKADWDAIRAVRERIKVPLIANGDVDSAEDCAEILRRSGADAVMIGRAAQGRPWHPAVVAGACVAPAGAELAACAVEHYRLMLDFYGAVAGLRHARKHVGWYLDRHAPGIAAAQRGALMVSTDAEFVADRLAAVLVDGGTAAGRMKEKAA